MTLVKIEGLGNISNTQCHVTLNDQKLETVPVKDLGSQHHVLTIPSKGILRISVEDHLVLASLKFNMRIIKCEGYHWLPMFTIPQDTIFEVPEEVGLPRVLLIFQARKFLSPVIEITETSELSENIDFPEIQEIAGEETSSTLELRMKILQLEHSLHSEKVSNLQNIEKLQNEYKISTTSLMQEMEKFKSWKETYSEKSKLLSEEIEQKNNKIKILSDEKQILSNELELYKNKFAEVLSNQETLSTLLKSRDEELSLIKSPKKKMIALSVQSVQGVEIQQTIKKRRPKLLNLSVENINPEQQNKPAITDPELVDFYLQNSLSSLKLEGFFQKTQEHYYKIGNKTVGVILKNNNIYCKFGEAYKTLESYIYTQCNSELDIFIKKRVNSKPGHRKTNTLTLSFDKTLVLNKSFRIENGSSLKSVKNKSITPCLANRKRRVKDS